MAKKKKGIFGDFSKFNKRLTLSQNVFKGKLAEQNYVLDASASGKETKGTGHGSDYKERKVDLMTGKKGPWTLVEVKSGGAKLSKLQKKTKRKSKRYKIARY